MGAYDGEVGATAALRHIACDERIKAYVLRNPLLYSTLLRAARRFIGGETLPECLAVASTLNGRGFATTIDHMMLPRKSCSMFEYPWRRDLIELMVSMEGSERTGVILDLRSSSVSYQSPVSVHHRVALSHQVNAPAGANVSSRDHDKRQSVIARHPPQARRRAGSCRDMAYSRGRASGVEKDRAVVAQCAGGADERE